jgi:hypothetical protein
MCAKCFGSVKSYKQNDLLKSYSEPGVVVHAYNPHTQEAEAGGS